MRPKRQVWRHLAPACTRCTYLHPVHHQFLLPSAGRESVRGLPGGHEPVVLTDATGATLRVAAGALAEDTAVAFQSAILSSFLPATPSLVPVGEFAVDLAGRTLGTPAVLDVPLSTVGAGLGRSLESTDTLLVARIERVDGVPHPMVVALAEVSGDRVVSQVPLGFAGVVRGGRYVLYVATVPVGVVGGFTRLADGTGARSVVATDTAPFIAVGATTGEYTVTTLAGPATVTARVTGTALRREESVAIPGGVGSGFSRTIWI